MKLSNEDKRYFLSHGYVEEENFPQIERASVKTVITLHRSDGSTQRLSTEQAISLMGREYYLNRLARAAFHRDSCGDVEGYGRVFFDVSKLFEDLKNL